MASDNILEVKKLQVSFRTNNGTVKAVREISFNLKRGETLAIVGESGSGKSVTSKAILGILAGNSIIDGGEILYDGRDLLKLSEKEMYKLRGEKISMIFQDPLSSLDPIVKIGKQITEAMILKNQDSRKTAKLEFNTMLKNLNECILAAVGESADQAEKDKINQMCKTFDEFNIKGLGFENHYNNAHSSVLDAVSHTKDLLFRIEMKQKVDIASELKILLDKFKFFQDPFLLNGKEAKLTEYKTKLDEIRQKHKSDIKFKDKIVGIFKYVDNKVEVKDEEYNTIVEFVKFLEEIMSQTKPDFFRIGYYVLKNPDFKMETLTSMPVEKLNKEALEYLDKNFMLEFIKYAELGVKYSAQKANEGKQKVVDTIDELDAKISALNEKKELLAALDEYAPVVTSSIDKLAPVKNTMAYTLISSLKYNVEAYFKHKVSNEKEQARFEKQTAKKEALLAKGKKVEWNVVPAKYVKLEDSVKNIHDLIFALKNYYVEVLAKDTYSDAEIHNKCVALIDFFKAKASEAVYVVTKSIAKERAIKLMEEVGIPEPRIRFYQYPFEFSGGMRQRIVIAIALASNPEVLICDEPTTALDVTIQSQILELINKLKVEKNLSIIFITHDLGVVANMADRIAVMYAGKIVEYGSCEEVFYQPAHPYTWALLSSMPDLDTKEKLEAIPGTPPNMIYPPVGDAFADRNKYALKIDFEKQPPMFKITDTHFAATWLLHPNAPKIGIPKTISDRIARMKVKNEGGMTDGE